MTKKLHEQDYVAWLQEQAEKLRSYDNNALDWQTLADELVEIVDK